MKKKIISALIVILVIGGFLVNHLISYANVANVANPPLSAYLTKTDLNGTGYGIADPKNGGEYIWNIMSYDSNGNAEQRNLYCVNADYGTTWFDGQTWEDDQTKSGDVEYNLYYDIQDTADRNKLINFTSDTNDADEVVEKLLTAGTDGIYEQLLWLFDNAYIKDNKATTDAEIKANVLEYLYNQLGIVEYTYTDEDMGTTMIGYESDTVDYGEGVVTESDIIAIQKMAIWYFTDGKDEKGESTIYDKSGDSDTQWLNIITDGETEYEGLENVGVSGRNTMAMDLYKHLITTATKKGDTQYTEQNNYTITSVPAEVNITGVTQQADKKYVLNSTRNGANYLIGPITIEEKNDLDFDIIITVTDGNGTPLTSSQYTITDANGNAIQYPEQKDLVGIQGGFYVSVPRNTVERVNVKVDITYDRIYKKLWLQGTEDTNGNITKLETEQPLVEIIEDPKTVTVELTAQPEEFDLALRKYITAVDATAVTNTRIPNISLDTLQTGTTATYKHRKDPVVVEDGAEVTYKLTIYNEGTKSGYASKIVDQLPTGLINSTNNTATVQSKDKDGNVKNTYTLAYNTTTNQITLTIVNTNENSAKALNSYATGTLDYETIEIKCKVAQEADTKNQIILTNVAWIAEAYDAESNETITTSEVGKDRDSAPGSAPSVNKDNMQNYKGNETNKNELADSEYFYQGQQDDDDFEKLVIMPIVKKFDLALFKHIAAISKDKIIEDGEYVTDTGNKDGTYLRAPVVTAIDPTTGKITYKQDDKDALTVEPGDYVLYTIRVYNEGEVDGYASKIKDTLPIGLEFVEADENADYYGIWNLDEYDTDGRQIVSTTWFAKGQGAELNAKEGDANYQANLLKALVKDGTITNENPDYIDAQVLCRVVEQATSDRVLVNYAQIADDSDKDGNEIDDLDSTPNEWIDEDDDQDIERIKLQCFDLSLRKFITAVNGTELKDSNGKYTREPVVDVSKLIDKTETTAIYTHPKASLAVQLGDKILYTIRVYNEGDIDGFASEITDYLPKYLTYIKDSEINKTYGWQVSEDGRTVTTKHLANTKLKAFDDKELKYADVKIECLVSDTTPFNENQTNIAEISEYIYNNNVVEKDIDSTSDNIEDIIPTDENLPSYKDDQINNSYVPGNEDDDDFEKIYVKEFDLALRKFITEVQEKEITTRVPQVKIENGNISYEHTKDALTVHVGDVVIYTLRIYNEGEIDGYASEITDDIPEYLQFLPDETTNVQYMWKMYDKDGKETENVENAVKVKTNYLSKENGENNLIKAFDGQTLSYKDIKIAFEVIDPNSNQYIITNHAQISDDTDKEGNEVIDKDSEPNVWTEGEDDQDIENVKVEYFDLSLLKFVSKVILIENGNEKITETGYNGHENPEPVVKVELHKKKLKDVTVKFGYGITITNEGDIPGYATEITDYVPEGLKFEASDNPNWTDEGNNVISTKQLENTLLQPGESKTIEVIFTWINGSENLALKTNVAEISDDKNEYDVPDKDSTPDNKIEGEDDQDLAKVILAITTGTAKTYFTLTLGLLAVVLVGVVLIKKFVI